MSNFSSQALYSERCDRGASVKRFCFYHAKISPGNAAGTKDPYASQKLPNQIIQPILLIKDPHLDISLITPSWIELH